MAAAVSERSELHTAAAMSIRPSSPTGRSVKETAAPVEVVQKPEAKNNSAEAIEPLPFKERCKDFGNKVATFASKFRELCSIFYRFLCLLYHYPNASSVAINATYKSLKMLYQSGWWTPFGVPHKEVQPKSDAKSTKTGQEASTATGWWYGSSKKEVPPKSETTTTKTGQEPSTLNETSKSEGTSIRTGVAPPSEGSTRISEVSSKPKSD